MANLKLAVISDLHIGDKARSSDLCPYENKLYEEQFIEKFIKFITDQKFKVDYLIVPGDVTGKAKLEEFELASSIILEVCSAFGLHESKILFVPGNHDKNWNVECTGNKVNDSIRMYQNLNQPGLLFEKIMSRSTFRGTNCRWAIWDYEDFLIVGYNSSWHDQAATDNPHHGLIEADALHEIEIKLKEINTKKEKLKLFLIHHHPISYSNHIPNMPDFSVTTNAENLLKLLSEFQFDLLLHGHRHMPHFNPSVQKNGHPIVIFGAGSFSYGLDQTYHGYAGNLFHIVSVNGRDAETNNIFGKVESWVYLAGHGWIESTSSTGIHPRVGFGTYAHPNVLKKQLLPQIKLLLQENDYLQWKTLVGQDEKLRYLHPDCVMYVLKEIAAELSIEIFGDSPEKLILLGKKV